MLLMLAAIEIYIIMSLAQHHLKLSSVHERTVCHERKMSRSSGLADNSRVRMHVQEISRACSAGSAFRSCRFAEVHSDHIGLPKSSLSSANLYDWNAEPAEQARLCSAQFADPVIVVAVKTNTATSVFAGH